MVVLVGYASAHGSTREIAERIGAKLGERGIRVEVRSLDRVGDTGAYDALVLGSAIHNQAWLPTAGAFVRRNVAALAGRPIWLFSVGMPAALRAPLRVLAAKQGPKVIAGFPKAVRLRLRDHRVFSGVVRPEHFPAVGRLFFKIFASRYGDFRNWREIDTWAEGIARELAGS